MRDTTAHEWGTRFVVVNEKSNGKDKSRFLRFATE
jgi:hypothetical protein